MDLFNTIKQKLRQINHDELLTIMGYHNLHAGHMTLQSFLKSDSIYLWLKNGHYDMHYTSGEFLHKLLEALDLASKGQDELKQCNRRLNAIRAMGNTPYVFVDTHFKRKSEPIFVLAAMESKRNIVIDKELLVFKEQSEILDMMGEIVKEHYISNNGEIPLWGKIHNYVYHHIDGRKFVFDIDGTLSQNQSEIMESRAELKI